MTTGSNALPDRPSVRGKVRSRSYGMIHVEQNEIGRIAANLRFGIGSAGRDGNRIAARCEHLPQQLALRR